MVVDRQKRKLTYVIEICGHKYPDSHKQQRAPGMTDFVTAYRSRYELSARQSRSAHAIQTHRRIPVFFCADEGVTSPHPRKLLVHPDMSAWHLARAVLGGGMPPRLFAGDHSAPLLGVTQSIENVYNEYRSPDGFLVMRYLYDN